MSVVHVTAELDYAVRALSILAAQPDHPVTTATLAENGMSVTFLQQVLGRLRCAGILRARRGTGGGYWLASAPEKISVGDLVRVLQPSEAVPPHLDIWADLHGDVQARLDRTTLAEIAGAPLTPGRAGRKRRR